MGKCGSKQSKSSVKSNNDDQYDFASVVDKFNEYSEEGCTMLDKESQLSRYQKT